VSAPRITGLLYVTFAVVSIFAFAYVPSTLIVQTDAAATATNLRASAGLFRFGITGEIVAMVLWLLVVVGLYRIFRTIDTEAALLMVSLVVIAATISFVGVLSELTALAVVSSDAFASLGAQREPIALMWLRLHGATGVLGQLFSGLWLLPLAVLLLRASVARVIGVLALVAGIAYLAVGLSAVATPAYASAVGTLAMPFIVGEFAVIAWLLFTRAREVLPHPGR
jgi:hypothetical protein